MSLNESYRQIVMFQVGRLQFTELAPVDGEFNEAC
jgi:hypothetical protein